MSELSTIAVTAAITAVVTVVVSRLADRAHFVLRIKGETKRIYQQIYTYWRTRKAQGLMKRRLLEGPFRVSIDYYGSCFGMNPRTAECRIRDEVIPNGPEWFNDYFIASALEALSNKEQVLRTQVLQRGTWPPKAVLYRFQAKKPGESVEVRRKEMETNGICYQYQRWMQQCPLTYRFEEESTQPLESAPPCERCWE